MVNQLYPSLNDIAPSWADIACTFTVFQGAILDMADFSGIKCSDAVTFGEQIGASGGRVIKRTTGSVKLTASAELYRSGHRKLVKALMAKAPTRGNQVLISLVTFDISIQHTPLGETEIYQVKISGCRLAKRDMDFKEGDDADKVSIDLNPMGIAELIDGKEIVLL